MIDCYMLCMQDLISVVLGIEVALFYLKSENNYQTHKQLLVATAWMHIIKLRSYCGWAATAPQAKVHKVD